MISYNELINSLKNHNGNIFMLIGNGSSNQFRYLKDLKFILKKILKNVPIKSAFLYFGDYPDKKKPDIGYAFQLIKEMRPDINIYMIQIKEAKSWGVPNFVKDVYWHTDYTNKCKWGGIYNNQPCSNTKKWVNIHKRLGINNIFILGGGQITLDEYMLIKKLKINYQYFLIERRFLGDGKTLITDNNTKLEKIGITLNKINKSNRD